MANIIIGTNATIGTVSSSPNSPLNQPHWKTATITPYAAPIESRFMTAALSGTSDRAEHHHQQQEREPDDDADEERQATLDAVTEVDERGGDHRPRRPRRRCRRPRRSSRSPRSWATRSAVATESGADDGMTTTTAARPSGLTWGGATFTPGSFGHRLFATASAGAVSSAFGSATASTSGPLEPGPKPRAMRS